MEQVINAKAILKKQKTKEAIQNNEEIPDLESPSEIKPNYQKIDSENSQVSLEIDALM